MTDGGKLVCMAKHDTRFELEVCCYEWLWCIDGRILVLLSYRELVVLRYVMLAFLVGSYVVKDNMSGIAVGGL